MVDSNTCEVLFQIQGPKERQYTVKSNLSGWGDGQGHQLTKYVEDISTWQSDEPLKLEFNSQIEVKAMYNPNVWQSGENRKATVPSFKKAVVKIEFDTEQISVFELKDEQQSNENNNQQQDNSNQQQSQNKDLEESQHQQLKQMLDDLNRQFEEIQTRNSQIVDSIKQAKDNLESLDKDLKNLQNDLQQPLESSQQ